MSDVKLDKRPYHSPLRKEQALATRERILDAALELFGANGYGATSIATVAREAGVVPETIYATFGSKRGIVDGLIERAVTPLVLEDIEARWQAASDPAAQLGVVASFATEFWAQNHALAAVFRRGTGDAEIGDEWTKRQALRRDFFGHLLAGWPAGTVRGGLRLDRAVDAMWALAGDEMFQLLVGDRGWTATEYEAWLTDLLQREILGGR